MVRTIKAWGGSDESKSLSLGHLIRTKNAPPTPYGLQSIHSRLNFKCDEIMDYFLATLEATSKRVYENIKG